MTTHAVLINALLNDCTYPVVYKIEVWSIGRPHVWCEVRSLVSQQLGALCTRGALESKSHQQLDRCLAATVWAARHHSNSSVHHSLSPLATWKQHQCTSAWRHRLKQKRRNVFIRNQRGMSVSWNGIWLKCGQQPAELHWSIDRSLTRLFYCLTFSEFMDDFYDLSDTIGLL